MNAMMPAGKLADCKRDFAVGKLEWLAAMAENNNSNIRVTVRFAQYGEDYDLATQIKAIIEQHTHWPVTLNGSNVPVIKQDDKFRVIFESGWAGNFDPVASAFAMGALVPGVIGHRHADRADQGHLIVEVLPNG